MRTHCTFKYSKIICICLILLCCLLLFINKGIHSNECDLNLLTKLLLTYIIYLQTYLQLYSLFHQILANPISFCCTPNFRDSSCYEKHFNIITNYIRGISNIVQALKRLGIQFSSQFPTNEAHWENLLKEVILESKAYFEKLDLVNKLIFIAIIVKSELNLLIIKSQPYHLNECFASLP